MVRARCQLDSYCTKKLLSSFAPVSWAVGTDTRS